MNKRNVRPDKVLRVNDMKDLSLDAIVEAYRNGYTLEGASLEQIKELERIPLQSMAVTGCQSVTITTPITVTITNYGFIKCTSASYAGCDFTTIPSTCPTISSSDYFNIGIEFTVANIPTPDSTKKITLNYTVNYTKNGTTYSSTLSGTVSYVNGKGYLSGLLYNVTGQQNFQGAVSDAYAIQSVTLTSFVLP